MPTLPRPPLRLLASVAALVLVLGAGACGSDDGGDGQADGADSGGDGRYAAGEPSGDGSADDDEAAARIAVERLYAAMAEGDAEGVCGQLNEAARDQIAQGGLSGQEASTCVEGFERFFEQAEEAGGLNATLNAKVRSVEIDGRRAVATVNFGPGQNGEVPLVRVDGEWKLEAAGATSGG